MKTKAGLSSIQKSSPKTPTPAFDIDAYIAKRTEFITKVNSIMVDGKDYHVIQGKKSLAKGGAEKLAAIFSWVATFEKDSDTVSMLSDVTGMVAFVCNLTDQSGKVVGQGRGAAVLSKNAGDPNKTIKMAQKSSFVDAILRGTGLSDFFTQDLQDMNPADIAKPFVKPASSVATQPVKPFIKTSCDPDKLIKMQDLFVTKHIPLKWVQDTIEQQFGKQSSRDLTNDEADQLIKILEDYDPTLESKIDNFKAEDVHEARDKEFEQAVEDADKIIEATK